MGDPTSNWIVPGMAFEFAGTCKLLKPATGLRYQLQSTASLLRQSYAFRRFFALSVAVYCTRAYAVAQLVEALCYKPEGREFDPRWCYWNFSLT